MPENIGEFQKTYLLEAGLLDYFDFSFVEHNLQDRNEPGDITRFITWFTLNYLRKISHFHKNINVNHYIHLFYSSHILNLNNKKNIYKLYIYYAEKYISQLPHTFINFYS